MLRSSRMRAKRVNFRSFPGRVNPLSGPQNACSPDDELSIRTRLKWLGRIPLVSRIRAAVLFRVDHVPACEIQMQASALD